MGGPGRVVETILLGVALFYLLFQVGRVALQDGQPDFRTYYYATQTWLAGGDPYDLGAVSEQSPRVIDLAFVYPPYARALFVPIARLPYRIAYVTYLAFKCLALVGLLLIWRRLFPEVARDPALVMATIAFGFRETVIRDLATGNVSLYEQLILWSGIYLAVHHRAVASGLAIAGSALLKTATIFFAPLVAVLRPSRKGVVGAGIAVLSLGLLHLSTFMSDGAAYASFIRLASGMDERGGVNPSALALCRDVAGWAGFGDIAGFAIYGVFVLGVLAVGVRTLRRLRYTEDPRLLISLWVLTYVLVMPRMKNYSYIVAIMPALFLVGRIVTRPIHRWGLLAMIWIGLFGYQPLLTVLLLFGLLARYAERGTHRVPSVV